MNNISLLSFEQVFGNDKLGVLKRYGLGAPITDFAIFSGGYVDDNPNIYDLKNRRGKYWIISNRPPESHGSYEHVVSETGTHDWANIIDINVALRPIMSYPDLSYIPSNVTINKDGIKTVEYGMYPKWLVSKKENKLLEKVYLHTYYHKMFPLKKGCVNATYNIYKTNCARFSRYIDTRIELKNHLEYEYDNKRYIRFIASEKADGKILSDGR